MATTAIALLALTMLGLAVVLVRSRGVVLWPVGVTADRVAAGVAVLVTLGLLSMLFIGREPPPDLGPLIRFEFPTIGHVYDSHGRPLAALAREYRQIVQYADIPPVVRDAILATEDKRFFSHDGVDYLSFPRLVAKVRLIDWVRRLSTGAWRDEEQGRAIFPQGGSTITQQLVRGVFLQRVTAVEGSQQVRTPGALPRIASWLIGARNVNMILRKREEIRLSFWIEQEMQRQFGSKRRAKEEILARYASVVYMGHGQYGFERAAEFYFGKPLSSLTADDADSAALLAGIAKSPPEYAPATSRTALVLRRRNQILSLMAAEGFLSPEQVSVASRRPLRVVSRRQPEPPLSSAVIEHVLDELTAAHPDLGVDDLLQGDIQVHSTVDLRVQRIVAEALEHGLARYEERHPRARGVVQGSVVVLSNGDGSVLAEAGGRQVYRGRPSAFSDFNRVRRALRQPGSTMKPIVYLAAFRRGDFTLETLVPDEPISVPDGGPEVRKWISNYDGRFKGLIPVREALAESRNAVAIWIAGRLGIDAVLKTSRSLGIETPLQRYPTTALGASEVNLLELATAYRTIASGVRVRPYVIRELTRGSGEPIQEARPAPVAVNDDALALIQEGLRGVVRIPTGTAHALDSRAFPVAVMGKTGTTNEFKDALFVGSTYGIDGVTVAVRIGFDDGRSLGAKETGGRVALPVFEEVMLRIYRDRVVGPVPAFPSLMEQRITRYVEGDVPERVLDSARADDGGDAPAELPSPVVAGWLERPTAVAVATATASASSTSRERPRQVP